MRTRSKRGTGFVEAVVAAIVLIPIALCLMDLIVLVIANSMHDTACKNAARAAANQPDQSSANSAADKSLESFRKSGIVKAIQINTVEYGDEAVAVETQMLVKLPVPFPGINDLSFKAVDIEPIVVMKKDD